MKPPLCGLHRVSSPLQNDDVHGGRAHLLRVHISFVLAHVQLALYSKLSTNGSMPLVIIHLMSWNSYFVCLKVARSLDFCMPKAWGHEHCRCHKCIFHHYQCQFRSNFLFLIAISSGCSNTVHTNLDWVCCRCLPNYCLGGRSGCADHN